MKIQRLGNARIYRGFGILHGDKNGAPVLVGESSWRTVSGFFMNTKLTGMVCVEFRHYSKAYKN